MIRITDSVKAFIRKFNMIRVQDCAEEFIRRFQIIQINDSVENHSKLLLIFDAGGGDRSAMSSGDEQSDEEAVPLFRPFTKESLASIEARIAEASARKAERERLKAEGEIGPDGIPEHYSIPHHEERLEPDPP
ncbi:uncharacterized protein CEXT_370621 [Caerostris extrusa]|uniref:Uncharacterized protein n=1 Tax=Caerostris extrusa TaxID=172846 RepID=A0AAV4PBT5_CAEEX|nr:uncharacterized protein CEXT_370621 [Caerostris extrusa]